VGVSWGRVRERFWVWNLEGDSGGGSWDERQDSLGGTMGGVEGFQHGPDGDERTERNTA